MTDYVYGEAYNSCLVSQCQDNSLSDPPNSVGYELKAPRFVKSLCCFNQTKIPLIDQISKTQAKVLILLCNRYNKSEICIYQTIPCIQVPFMYPSCKVNLFFCIYQLNLAYLIQVFVCGWALPVGNLLGDFQLSHLREDLGL